VLSAVRPASRSLELRSKLRADDARPSAHCSTSHDMFKTVLEACSCLWYFTLDNSAVADALRPRLSDLSQCSQARRGRARKPGFRRVEISLDHGHALLHSGAGMHSSTATPSPEPGSVSHHTAWYDTHHYAVAFPAAASAPSPVRAYRSSCTAPGGGWLKRWVKAYARGDTGST
jgi:hypothetical protein